MDIASFTETGIRIRNTSPEQVERALRRSPEERSMEDLEALLSPAAQPRLAEMAAQAEALTRFHFGTEVCLFAPLYLSNTCKSVCTYCSFSHSNHIERRTLTPDEAEQDARVLQSRGIRKVILLTGEDYAATPVPYLCECISRMRPYFESIRLEIYPLDEDKYARLMEAGMDGVIVYQETYDRERYEQVHLRGMKKRFEYRLNALDRAARAGVRLLSPGALLGLSDAAADVAMVGAHARHLMTSYDNPRLIISLPRLRPAVGLENIPEVSDQSYMQYLFAIRLFVPTAELVMTTREDYQFRAAVAPKCINLISAGVNIAPGGYSGSQATPQFEIADDSSLPAISHMIRSSGLRPVF